MIERYQLRRFDIHHLNGLCGKRSLKYDKVDAMPGLITLCHKCHFNRHDWSKWGQPSPLKKVERNALIKNLHAAGHTGSAIARELKISRQRVHQLLHLPQHHFE